MIKIRKFEFSPFSENTYVLWDESTLQAAIVDPGCYEEKEEIALDEFVNSNDLRVDYLINTHCHIDHIFGNVFVINQYKPKFIVPEKDLPLLRDASMQGEIFGVDIASSPEPDDFITEDDDLQLGESVLKFLFTPGHTPGEYCIYSPEDNFCITGDVLFYQGIGRTDLWGGSHPVLLKSIRNKLFKLPDQTVIYPGHGQKSTIGYEKLNNPFLR